MSLKDFDEMIAIAQKKVRPRKVVLAGSEKQKSLEGLFRAQAEGFADPVLVGDREKTLRALEQAGLSDRTYEMIEVAPGHDAVQTAIDEMRLGDGEILMRGDIMARDFLMPVLEKSNGLRKDGRLMSHVTLADIPDYPKLIGLSDMAVIMNPDLNKKKSIIKNMVEAFTKLGYEDPAVAILTLTESVSFHQLDTVDAQRICHEQERHPIAPCKLWGPISYDLIMDPKSAENKEYSCPYLADRFDAIAAPNINTAITLLKSWMIHAGATVCGTIVGADIPIAFVPRSASAYEEYLSILLSVILA